MDATPLQTSSVPATIPFRVAQAYGAKSPQPAAPVSTSAATAKKPTLEPTARGLGTILTQTSSGLKVRPLTRDGDTVEVSGIASAAARTKSSTLVGAKVARAMDYGASMPTASESLALYKHPADRNAAATGVDAGRKIDTTG